MKVLRVVLLLGLVMVYGCSTSPLDKAMKQGAPTLDKSWAYAEYASYQQYLAKLELNAYPRAETGPLSPLFRKLVSSAEQKGFDDDHADLKSRIKTASQLLLSISDILRKYTQAYKAGNDYTLELAHIFGVTLSMSRQLLELVDELFNKFPESRKNAKASIAKMERGLMMQVGGMIYSLGMNRTHDRSRKIIVNSLIKEQKVVMGFFSTKNKKKIMQMVEKRLAVEGNQEIKKKLKQFLAYSKGI